MVAPSAIRLDLNQRLRAVWDRGHISVGELWGYYCKYPYLTRLRDRSVLVDGVSAVLSSLAWQLVLQPQLWGGATAGVMASPGSGLVSATPP